MCLNYINRIQVSDGTVEVWKMFEYKVKEDRFESPFRHKSLPISNYRDNDRVPYTADRDPHMLSESLFDIDKYRGKTIDAEFNQQELDQLFRDSVPFFDSCEGGFVHSYPNAQIAYTEINAYYHENFWACVLLKGIIPEGEEYYIGLFDGDIDAIAAKCVMLTDVIQVNTKLICPIEFKGHELCLQDNYNGKQSLENDMEYIRKMFSHVREKDYSRFSFKHEDGSVTPGQYYNNDYRNMH